MRTNLACRTLGCDSLIYFPNLKVEFNLQNPYVLVGLLVGAMLPYLFGSFGMKAVG
ncbi:MAG: sodium/proton-translocating pyrophosphatase, partial [Holosporales bacterium]|nr:sodium/proton-translocating pyrophosphatase [Holosporales bacterium]